MTGITAGAKFGLALLPLVCLLFILGALTYGRAEEEPSAIEKVVRLLPGNPPGWKIEQIRKKLALLQADPLHREDGAEPMNEADPKKDGEDGPQGNILPRLPLNLESVQIEYDPSSSNYKWYLGDTLPHKKSPLFPTLSPSSDAFPNASSPLLGPYVEQQQELQQRVGLRLKQLLDKALQSELQKLLPPKLSKVRHDSFPTTPPKSEEKGAIGEFPATTEPTLQGRGPAGTVAGAALGRLVDGGKATRVGGSPRRLSASDSPAGDDTTNSTGDAKESSPCSKSTAAPGGCESFTDASLLQVDKDGFIVLAIPGSPADVEATPLLPEDKEEAESETPSHSGQEKLGKTQGDPITVEGPSSSSTADKSATDNESKPCSKSDTAPVKSSAFFGSSIDPSCFRLRMNEDGDLELVISGCLARMGTTPLLAEDKGEAESETPSHSEQEKLEKTQAEAITVEGPLSSSTADKSATDTNESKPRSKSNTAPVNSSGGHGSSVDPSFFQADENGDLELVTPGNLTDMGPTPLLAEHEEQTGTETSYNGEGTIENVQGETAVADAAGPPHASESLSPYSSIFRPWGEPLEASQEGTEKAPRRKCMGKRNRPSELHYEDVDTLVQEYKEAHKGTERHEIDLPTLPDLDTLPKRPLSAETEAAQHFERELRKRLGRKLLKYAEKNKAGRKDLKLELKKVRGNGSTSSSQSTENLGGAGLSTPSPRAKHAFSHLKHKLKKKLEKSASSDVTTEDEGSFSRSTEDLGEEGPSTPRPRKKDVLLQLKRKLKKKLEESLDSDVTTEDEGSFSRSTEDLGEEGSSTSRPTTKDVLSYMKRELKKKLEESLDSDVTTEDEGSFSRSTEDLGEEGSSTPRPMTKELLSYMKRKLKKKLEESLDSDVTTEDEGSFSGLKPKREQISRKDNDDDTAKGLAKLTEKKRRKNERRQKWIKAATATMAAAAATLDGWNLDMHSPRHMVNGKVV